MGRFDRSRAIGLQATATTAVFAGISEADADRHQIPGTTTGSCPGNTSSVRIPPAIEHPATMRDFGLRDGETRTRTGDTTIFSRYLQAARRREIPANCAVSAKQVQRSDVRNLRAFLGDSGVDGHLRPNTAARPDSVRREPAARFARNVGERRRDRRGIAFGARSSGEMPAGSAWPACVPSVTCAVTSCSLGYATPRRVSIQRELANRLVGRAALATLRKRASTPRGSTRLHIVRWGRLGFATKTPATKQEAAVARRWDVGIQTRSRRCSRLSVDRTSDSSQALAQREDATFACTRYVSSKTRRRPE